MNNTPFRGILYGVTEVPGYELPVVDGELCDDEESVIVWPEPQTVRVMKATTGRRLTRPVYPLEDDDGR